MSDSYGDPLNDTTFVTKFSSEVTAHEDLYEAEGHVESTFEGGEEPTAVERRDPEIARFVQNLAHQSLSEDLSMFHC